MPYLGNQPSSGGYHKLDNLTASATDTYALTLGGSAYYPATANQLMVSLNGVIQAPQDSFTISGSNIVFASTLSASDSIDFIMSFGDVYGIGTPADGTITDAKIQSMAASKLTGALPAIDGSALTGVSAGKLLNLVSTEKTDQFTTTSTSFVDVTGMSATITPSSTSSKILVFFTVGLVGNSTGGQFCYAQLVRDSTAISVGDIAGSRIPVSAGFGGDVAYENGPLTIHVLDSPSTTSATTYKIQFRVQSGGTAKFNSRGDDADNSGIGRTSASLTVMEIEA